MNSVALSLNSFANLIDFSIKLTKQTEPDDCVNPSVGIIIEHMGKQSIWSWNSSKKKGLT